MAEPALGRIDGDVPDPALAVDGSTYLAYSTNTDETGTVANVPVRASFDLAHWTASIDALPVLPAWAEPGYIWAPTVRKLETTWVMYFTARERVSGLQCIGVATSSTSTGPYLASGDGPVVCQRSLGGSIDPEIVVTQGGSAWLLWKNDGNCCAIQTGIWSAPLGTYGRVTTDPTLLLSATATWQQGIIENPTAIETATGYVLLYSGGRWSDASYGTGMALCASLSTRCVNASTEPLFDDADGSYGSGGMSTLALADGRILAIWHSWSDHRRSAGRSATITMIETAR